jgi:hypothetical protein
MIAGEGLRGFTSSAAPVQSGRARRLASPDWTGNNTSSMGVIL